MIEEQIKLGNYSLQNIISIQDLEDITQHFSAATRLITIVADFRGNTLTENNTAFYCPFCKKLRLEGGPGEGCDRSDAYAGLEAARLGTPYIYKCHMGFVEIASPIMVNGMYLGIILMGQVLTEPDIMETLPTSVPTTVDLDADPELKALYEISIRRAPVIPIKQLKAYAGLMSYLSTYIAQSGLNSVMKEQLNDNRVKYLEAKNTQVALEKDKILLKLKNIRMRVHPHFLFNALNVVNGLAVLEEAEKTSEAIVALSGILRSSLKKEEQLITVREEMQYVANYLTIQKLAMQDRVEVDCQVDDNCLDALIPLFAIESIVENSFIHGLEDRPEGGRLMIALAQTGGFMRVVVQDNGAGINPEVLKALKEEAESPRASPTRTGLHSLIMSLRYYFGESACWNIQSDGDTGTRIELRIPLRFSA